MNKDGIYTTCSTHSTLVSRATGFIKDGSKKNRICMDLKRGTGIHTHPTRYVGNILGNTMYKLSFHPCPGQLPSKTGVRIGGFFLLVSSIHFSIQCSTYGKILWLCDVSKLYS